VGPKDQKGEGGRVEGPLLKRNCTGTRRGWWYLETKKRIAGVRGGWAWGLAHEGDKFPFITERGKGTQIPMRNYGERNLVVLETAWVELVLGGSEGTGKSDPLWGIGGKKQGIDSDTGVSNKYGKKYERSTGLGDFQM